MDDLTCIGCPMGCQLEIQKDEEKILVEGNECARGKEYAVQEIKDPRRALSSVVSIIGAEHTVLPVKTDRPIPRDAQMQVIDELRKLYVYAPVHNGQILKENIAGTGANLIATREMKKA